MRSGRKVSDTAQGAITPKLAAIRAFRAAGFVLVPLCSLTVPHEHRRRPCRMMGKVPTRQGWEDSKADSFTEEELAAGNYGVVIGDAHVVVDVDPRNFRAGDHPVARLVERVGQPLKSFTAKTGGGGYHIFFKLPPGTLVRNALPEFPGVEFKSGRGRQVVGAGSGHASGAMYVIADGSPAEIVEAPAALVDLIRRADVPFAEVGTGKYVNDAETQGRFLAYLQDVAEPSVQGRGGDANAFKVACYGRDLALPPALTYELMLEVWNPRCSPPWEDAELRSKVVNAYTYSRGPVGSAHPAADFGEVAVPLSDPLDAKPAAPEPVAWVTAGQGGKMVKCFQNLVMFFSHGPAGLVKVFGYNEFTGRVEFTNPAPWHRGRLPQYRGVGDADLKLLKAHLAMRHAFEMPVQNIEEAVTVAAHANKFHPVREYLEGLTWDGRPRLDHWLTDYLGVEDGEYTRAVARKVLCAAVMRVMKPGCKFDHVLVLEGRQDLGKSSVVKILGGDHAADFPIDPHNKDSVQQMQGKWFIELAELEVTRRTEAQALKAFITRAKDEARLAYGRTVGEFPRQSVFIASYNPVADQTYLTDEENRRWWPVRCGEAAFDLKAFRAVRDLLFAEAMHVVKTKGEHLYMETAELKGMARSVAAGRRAEHPWQERIAQWIAESDRVPETRRDFLTARDVFVDAMGGIDKNLDRRSCLAIATAMRALGWKDAHKRMHGTLIRGYARRVPSTVDKKILDILGDLV